MSGRNKRSSRTRPPSTRSRGPNEPMLEILGFQDEKVASVLAAYELLEERKLFEYSSRSAIVFRNVNGPSEKMPGVEKLLQRSNSTVVIAKETLVRVVPGVYARSETPLVENEKEKAVREMLLTKVGSGTTTTAGSHHQEGENAQERRARAFLVEFFDSLRGRRGNSRPTEFAAAYSATNVATDASLGFVLNFERPSSVVEKSSPILRVGGALSCTAFGDEDSSLDSLHVLRKGAPRVWLVTDHLRTKELVEKFSQEPWAAAASSSSVCPRALASNAYCLDPALLDRWNIGYCVFEQSAGDAVYVRGGSFRTIIDTGFNISETVAYGDLSWQQQQQPQKRDAAPEQPPCYCASCPDRNAAATAAAPDPAARYKVVLLKRKFYICPEEGCPYRTSLKKDLERHQQDRHSKTYPCDVCDEKFSFPSNMRRHRLSHFPKSGGLRKCTVCERSFRDLAKHAKTHDSKYRRKCRFCRRKLTDRSIKKHERRCSRRPDEDDDEDLVDDDNGEDLDDDE